MILALSRPRENACVMVFMLPAEGSGSEWSKFLCGQTICSFKQMLSDTFDRISKYGALLFADRKKPDTVGKLAKFYGDGSCRYWSVEAGRTSKVKPE